MQPERPKLTMRLDQLPGWLEGLISDLENPIFTHTKAEIANGLRHMLKTLADTPQTDGGRILTCVYCGHEYPQDTPSHGDKVLTNHIAECDKHPMREVVEERDRLRDAYAGAREGLLDWERRAQVAEAELELRKRTK